MNPPIDLIRSPGAGAWLAAPVIQRHIMSTCRHAHRKCFHGNLDPTLSGGNQLVTNHRDSQMKSAFPVCTLRIPRQKRARPLLLHVPAHLNPQSTPVPQLYFNIIRDRLVFVKQVIDNPVFMSGPFYSVSQGERLRLMDPVLPDQGAQIAAENMTLMFYSSRV